MNRYVMTLLNAVVAGVIAACIHYDQYATAAGFAAFLIIEAIDRLYFLLLERL